jgi:ubiquinone/menaquinone biosynthesis C-methylase UbiE
MEKSEPTFTDLLLETHIGLERQGPGSPETVMKALGFLGSLDRFEQVADLGCGTGGQTMLLAEYLPGHIAALDMFPAFIDELKKKAKNKNLENRVEGVLGNMGKLPFQENSFDLIWSEGAIDNIGFRKGLVHWRRFLKNGGYIAVTSPTWLTGEHLEIVDKFWRDAGSRLDTVQHNIKIMQDSGYTFVAAFALTENCWTENYFTPREAAIRRLLEKYGKSETMQKYAELNRHEVELYLKYKQHYGYVFYIGKAV